MTVAVIIVLTSFSGCAFFIPAFDDSVTEENERQKEQQQKEREKMRPRE